MCESKESLEASLAGIVSTLDPESMHGIHASRWCRTSLVSSVSQWRERRFVPDGSQQQVSTSSTATVTREAGLLRDR